MKINFMRFGALLGAVLLMISCNNDDNTINNNNVQEKIILNTDSSTLNNRIKFDNSGVLDINLPFAGKDNDPVAGSFPLELVAEINPPVYQGLTLKATHVAINGNYAYVSYNMQGEAYAGAIDVIDITNPNVPQLVMQAILPNTDVSSVSYDNGVLYIAGAASIDAYQDLDSPAFVAAMTLSNGLLTTNYAQTTLTGNVGTSVTSSGNKYFAVSGDNGALAQLNKSTHQVEMAIPVSDLRAVAYNSNKVVILSGTQGIKVYNANNLNQQNTFATSQDVADAKRTIDFLGNNSLLVSEGYNGLGVYNMNSGNKTQTVTVPTSVEGVDPSDITTNAVSVNDDKVYIANGGAGLYIYQNGNGNQGLDIMGSINLGSSCNYVISKDKYIFAAMGNGGLKIVHILSNVQTIDCTDFPTYNGSAWLNVNSNQTKEYQGSASIQGANINSNSNLTFCGSLAVSQGLNVNSNGTFYMKGSLAQGQANNPWLSLNVNSNAIFRVEGSVVIYGNLVLNSNSTIEFVGSGSSITIYGNVTKGSNVTITGTYTDTFNKLN
ncbi:LVIVD repeat-containing protein [Flavobacterium alkalisoli]|nr:hypothetical protein [Flavobacterium alkalisoli]